LSQKELVIDSIFVAIDEINEQLPEKEKINKSLDTVLVGQHDGLDSLGLVNFIVSVEQKIKENFGLNLSLALELDDMGSDDQNPFRTVGALGDFISGHIK
jgi:acyl carrier protein